MKILEPEHIVEQRRNRQEHSSVFRFTDVDRDRPFIPEQYTQLYHTDIYSELTYAQQLRYNQLFGVRTNEQFMLFESGFTNSVMGNILQHKMLDEKHSLKQCLNILLADEKKHYEMFRSLNVTCAPEIYNNSKYYFVRLSWFERGLLAVVSHYPQHIISLLWIVLLMEEHAVRFSVDLLKFKTTKNLGELEDNFVHAHTMHLKDEAKHVHIDANLIDFVLERSSKNKKAVNISLLNMLIKATLRPKHAGINVINKLVDEFPDLASKSSHLTGALRLFSYDPVMCSMLEDQSQIPMTMALLELYPEFEQALVI